MTTMKICPPWKEREEERERQRQQRERADCSISDTQHRQHRLRAFLTQSGSLSSTSAWTATSGFEGAASSAAGEHPWQSPPPMLEIRRAATADQARAKMAQLRRDRAASASSATSAALTAADRNDARYGRQRFQEALAKAVGTDGAADRDEDLTPTGSVTSKCTLSAYLTLAPVLDGPSSPLSLSSSSELRSTGKRRAQLMTQLRLRQPRLPVRHRHDRTAQELVQEGGLPSRRLHCPTPPTQSWLPDAYKFTPCPAPRLADWIASERQRLAQRQRLADELDDDDDDDDDGSAPTPPPPLEVLDPAATDSEDEAGANKEASAPEHQHQQRQQQKQQSSHLKAPHQHPRPGSGRSSRRGGHQRHQQHQQHQQHQHQQQQQQQDQKAAEAIRRRRSFSVSTIGDEEREVCRQRQQTIVGVCQRLGERRVARATAQLPPEDEPSPPPPPPPLEPSSSKKPQKSQKTQKQTASGKSGRRSGSAGSSRSSSGGSGKKQKQPKQQDKKKTKKEDEAAGSPAGSAAGKRSPRAKSPKATTAAGRQKKAGQKAKSKTKAIKTPSTPPQTAEPVQQPAPDEAAEPPQPDPVDLLADEIEAVGPLHRCRADGELPDYPCPSSEAKSRQQLTKLWCQWQAFPTSQLAYC